MDCAKFETLTVDGDAACCCTVLYGSGTDYLQWDAAVLSGDLLWLRVEFLIAVASCSLGSFFRFVEFTCCRSVIYRVFNLCVEGALYTGCSICVLQERYVQGVQFVCCSSVIYRVFNLCVAGSLCTGCSICVL